MTDKNLEASVCKSVPNGLNTLNSQISKCTSTVELDRNQKFATNVLKLKDDIDSLKNDTIPNALIMGDNMFGQAGYKAITNQVKDRNTDLKRKKETLSKEIEKGEAIIQRSDRDFNDVYNTVPNPQPKKGLHFIEDYTLAILVISYIFMLITIIYIYVSTSELIWIALGKAIIGSILLSMFLFMLLFYIT